MERDDFLANAQRRLAASPLADPGPVTHAAPSPAPAGDGLAARFGAALEALDGVVHQPEGPEEAIALVAAIAQSTGAVDYLSWDEAHIPLPGLHAGLARNGLERRPDAVPGDAEGRRTHQLGYFECAVGVTGAEAGFAATGSVALASGPGRSRMASLIAAVHIAILRRDDLYESLSDWLARHPDRPGGVANWTVITGPSRTADIEMVITRGVHGPRHVHVILV